MADIKNLFEKTKGQKILSNSNINKVGRSVESADYVEQEITFQNKVIPFVDFASASNFAKYGSAEKYYTDSINHITNEWPYDGSEKEKKALRISIDISLTTYTLEQLGMFNLATIMAELLQILMDMMYLAKLSTSDSLGHQIYQLAQLL